MKKTFGVSLNDRDPTQARIMAEIASRQNDSGAIRQMLTEYFAMLDYGQEVEIENRELRLDLAWARQNGAQSRRPSREAGEAEPEAVPQTAPGSIPLTDFFKNAVARAAKPGIRLEDVTSEENTAGPV